MSAALAPIALTAGEPAGIGPDLVVGIAGKARAGRVVAIGDPDVLVARASALGTPFEPVPFDADGPPVLDAGRLEVLSVPVAHPVTAGQLDPGNARSVLDMLATAANGCLDGRFSAMVTTPVHKGVINEAGIPFSGHTEFLAERTGSPLPVMLLTADDLRVALVTTHLPLASVAAAITRERLESTARILVADLTRLYGIATPRILVAGLSPHAGEGGHLGREEIDIIEPVLERLRTEGMRLEGPLPADTLFTPKHLAGADAVLAMYHDQGLPVLKYAGFGRAVNVTLGLPIVRTSVDHGTALDLAGRPGVDNGSLRAALAEATRMAAR